ncbi:protein Hook 3-like isoform X2, partial [Biomphalaria glabrata]|uniref:Uncharacterized protein n=1 Tax=Biomphalaria glabrata TaxID=6526 RepID=A0A2C9LBX9_BIOGL
EENYNLLEKKIINMQKKLKSLDGNCKESQETSAQITKELHLASEFMSMLQTKTESLTQEMHINIQSQDKKIEHVSDKIEKLLETNNLLARQSEEHLHRTQIQKLSVEL